MEYMTRFERPFSTAVFLLLILRNEAHNSSTTTTSSSFTWHIPGSVPFLQLASFCNTTRGSEQRRRWRRGAGQWTTNGINFVKSTLKIDYEPIVIMLQMTEQLT
jgi:hypothetical protein